MIPLSQLLESSRPLAATTTATTTATATAVPVHGGPDVSHRHSLGQGGSRRSAPDDTIVDAAQVGDKRGGKAEPHLSEPHSSEPRSTTLTSTGPNLQKRSHQVAARETLWSIASDRLGSSLRWREIAELNYHVLQSDGGALTQDHWIRPGWTLALPLPADQRTATSNREPTCHPGPLAISHVALDNPTSHDRLDRVDRVDRVDQSDGDQWRRPNGSGRPVIPVVPFGAGVVGAGMVSLLDRMRRVQQRHRRGGSFIKLPSAAQRSFEQRLRVSEGFGIGSDVDSAIRRLVQERDESAGFPTIKGVRVGDDVIELIVEGGGGVSTKSSPNSFAVDLDGRTYRIDRSALSATDVTDVTDVTDTAAADPIALHQGERLRRTSVPPAPLMVTAGHASGGLIMVNLESLGSLVVEGDPLGREGVMRALALELATSYWAGAFDLVLVGFGSELERFDRVLSASDTAALMDQVCRRRLNAVQLLQSTGYQSFAHGRCTEDSKRWDPLAVICGPTMSEADVGELLALADDPRLGIAVAAAGGSAGPRTC